MVEERRDARLAVGQERNLKTNQRRQPRRRRKPRRRTLPGRVEDLHDQGVYRPVPTITPSVAGASL